MRVLLISPHCSDRIPEVYNIGLAYVAMSLREDGHAVELVDLNTHHLSMQNAVRRIQALGPFDAIGIGSIVTTFAYVRALIVELKRMHPHTPIWAGNSLASITPELFLNNTLADVVVLGEGELTVKALASGTPLERINGIAYRKDGVVVRTAPQDPIADIDTIGVPAYDLFDIPLYLKGSRFRCGKRYFYLGVSSRGCPYHCTYCYHPFQGMKVRYHSPGRMIRDLELAMGRYDFDAFAFADDLFISKRSRVFEFCDLLEKHRIRKAWRSSARVNLVDEELVGRMKEAGCEVLAFGVESGNQTILDNIKKGVTVEQNRRAIDICRKMGMNYEFSLMVGNVGETRETVMDSVAFADYADRASVLFIATPYPGTELYEYGLKHNLIKDELRLIESYQEQSTTLLVNFSDMPDEELLRVKAEAEAMMSANYRSRHHVSGLRGALKEFWASLALQGPTLTVLKVVQRFMRALTGDSGYTLGLIHRLREGKVKMY